MLRDPRIKICFLFLLWVTYGKAQNAEVLPLNLLQALEMARNNYPELKKRLSEKSAAGEELDAVLASYLPRAGIQTQALFGTSNQVRGANLGYDGLLLGLSGSVKPNGYDWRPAWTSLASTVIDWRAFTFGKKQADRNLAESRQEIVAGLYEQELFEHQVKVADTYLMALNALKYSQLQERNLRRTEDIVAVTRANANAGLKAGIDSSIAVAESTRALLQWMDSQVQAKKYQVVLGELIGELGKELELDTMQFFAKLPNSFHFESSEPEKHPRLVTMYYRRKAMMDEIQKTRLGWLPDFYLLGSFWGRGSGIDPKPEASGDFHISSSLSGLQLRAFNYALGATLTWHPSRFFQVRKEVSAQRYRYDAFQEAYRAELLRIRAGLKNSDLQFNLAYQSVQQTPQMLSAAKQAYAQTRARYESGLENVMFLTQVTDLYIRAETEYFISVSNVWRSLLIKAAAKGDFNVFLEQISD